jgi:excisionase family DNA binding protein
MKGECRFVKKYQSNDPALDLQEVAGRLGVHVNTVRNLIKEGSLRAFRVGFRWRVLESELAAYIERSSSEVEGEEEE